jgi:hypothetical protein
MTMAQIQSYYLGLRDFGTPIESTSPTEGIRLSVEAHERKAGWIARMLKIFRRAG